MKSTLKHIGILKHLQLHLYIPSQMYVRKIPSIQMYLHHKIKFK